MRVVLDDCKAVTPGQLCDGVHLTAYSPVVQGNDRSGARGHERGELRLIQTEGVLSHVGKDRPRPVEQKGVDRGDEGKGGDDHLVARLQVEQQGADFQGVGAGGGQQRVRYA